MCVAIYAKFRNELRLDRLTNVKDLSQALERLFTRPIGRFARDLAFDPLPAEWIRIIENCQLILGAKSPQDDNRVGRLAAAVLVEKGSELRGELARHLIGPSAEDGQEAEVRPLDADVALSRQLERALL
ncbi:hypothetical protein EXV95_19125 [Acidovorax sp. JMULE5]|uniref:hypothetical protein n=1 Tax=Acidovorax sp. JMULE5 TaxID=2518343 RepID=UPI0015A0533E|nr:hypothetical protein [Acidovorax sp. JMULE5]QLA82562.1 hypothetical protein EXV95_19125 [Acidovorax sp. JMULE5]